MNREKLATAYTWLEPEARVHFVGIGGIGLSAIARVLLDQGYRVSGSDVRLSGVTSGLAAMGAVISQGHAAENVRGADLVVVSSAIPADNPELTGARSLGITVVKRDWILGRMMEGKVGIAIAGTHGKTTTSAMIATILDGVGLSPTFLVGGIIRGLETNARAGMGEHFVVEADEYDRCFLGLKPHTAVVTNIEMDHPDCYANLDAMKVAFRQYLALVPDGGRIVLCGDSPAARAVLAARSAYDDKGAPSQTYGFGKENDWRATDITLSRQGDTSFKAWEGSRYAGTFTVGVPGRHNALNGLAALITTMNYGVPAEVAGDILANFHGVHRRFEHKGTVRDVFVYDDYAHHPTEIKATLAAARAQYPQREIWAIFQPHTYSRTQALMDEFARSFGDADHVVITDIFAAREHNTVGVNARQVAERADHKDVVYIGSLREAAAWLADQLGSGALLLTMGAGSVYLVGEMVLEIMQGTAR